MKKHSHNRREFLGLTGTAVAAMATGSTFSKAASSEAGGAADPHHADLVVFNAKVYTVDRQQPKAEAFAVKGGRFVFVGKAEDAKTFIGKVTRTLDAKQMTIVPGFILPTSPSLSTAQRCALRRHVLLIGLCAKPTASVCVRSKRSVLSPSLPNHLEK